MSAPKKLFPDSKLGMAIDRKLVGQGEPSIGQLRREVARNHPSTAVRVPASTLDLALGEIDALREVVSVLAVEVRAFRDNVQLERDAPPGRPESCSNCRYFDGVKTSEAHTVPQRQAIVSEPGICVFGPPSAMPRTVAGGPPNASFFPPVHPSRWCGRWERTEGHPAA